ncbi:hypothetical protein [Pseudomonas sp. FME51]|uniref:hypothetical protein n=1 Tax=Pseudomonas sp. FME51 TaxID=2742609 RepID=UPI0018686C28|nr:hypothetical protein [Pseudomonas sp. FME51]
MSLVATLRIIAFYLLAVLVATFLGCLVQTQIHLAALQQLEVPASVTARLANTWPDLLSFAQLFLSMVAVTLAVFLPVAEGLSRIFRPWRWLLFALAGAGGIWLAFKAMGQFLPAYSFPAATLDMPGLLAIMAAVGVGSWLFGRLTRPRGKRGLRVLG